MNFLTSPHKLLWAGVGCVLLGFILPLLMVLGVIESSIGLSFFVFFLQMIGMILGVISTAGLAAKRRSEKKKQAIKKDADSQESTTGWMK